MVGVISMKIKIGKRYRRFLLAHEEGEHVNVTGFEDSSRARAYIEEMYGHAMNTSRTFTTGACIHMMECEYRVHNVIDVEKELVGRVVVIPFQAVQITMTNAFRLGIPLLGPEATKWVKTGEIVGPPENGSYVW